MKKLILISAILSLFITPGFSQQLKEVQIDSLVTVSLPAEYQKKDTLGQQVYTANGDLGYMVVLRAPNAKNTLPLKKERDFNNVLKDNVKNIQAEANNASAQFVRDTTIGALKGKIFTLKTDNGQGDIQLRNMLLVYTTGAIYTFEYAYPNNRQEVIQKEFGKFINSIKFSPALHRTDQYLSSANGMSPTLMIGLIGGGILIIIIVVMIRRRRMELE